MITSAQQTALSTLYAAAVQSGHIWPAMATCEGILESRWCESELYKEANNVFGTKQHSHPIYGTLNLPTKEYLDRKWVVINAAWVEYPTLSDAFTDRMGTLRRLAPTYPQYAAALNAKSPLEYINQLSGTWSSDPQRASKVYAIYKAHASLLIPPPAATT